MSRKVLTLGMVLILALSLLAVSMITCFTYDAEADGDELHYECWHDADQNFWVGVFHGGHPGGLHCQTM